MLRHILAVVCLASVLLSAAPARAQGEAGGPDAASVKVRIGPLMMTPTISLTNMGIDHNVFNDPPTRVPKEDFTFTLTPKTDVWLRMGPTWVTGKLDESVTWYQQYASERNANSLYGLGWSVPAARMNFKINGTYLNTRERPGFEIDTRAEHTDINFSASYDYNAFSKTFLGVTATQLDTRFVEDAEYLGINLHDSLNRRTLSYGVTARHQLTPLTGLSGNVTRQEDDFEYSPDRNTVATTANAKLEFAPEALLRGGISLGYELFRPVDPALPDFSGLVGSIDLTYVLLGSTRFAATASRGPRYSFDVNQPYYVQSQIGGSIAQQIFGPIDVQVRGDYAALDYRNRAGADVLVADRTDHVTTVGLGIGYHMGKDLRLSVNADHTDRDTRVLAHRYERLLLGVSLTYGF